MTSEPLFCALDSAGIAQLIRTAKHSVCYAGPGTPAAERCRYTTLSKNAPIG